MLYDISPPITPSLAVWPGDTPPSREVLMDMNNGDNITLSTLRATVHVGAHADAPNHYGATAPAIDQRSLHYYLGQCQVVRVRATRSKRIRPEELQVRVVSPRVLIATDSYADPEQFDESYAAPAPELIDYLHAAGVITVGVDTPSVDLFESKQLESHNRCLRHDMAILEGLVLSQVPEGIYELIALPLKLVGFDASPVRAVLRG